MHNHCFRGIKVIIHCGNLLVDTNSQSLVKNHFCLGGGGGGGGGRGGVHTA